MSLTESLTPRMSRISRIAPSPQQRPTTRICRSSPTARVPVSAVPQTSMYIPHPSMHDIERWASREKSPACHVRSPSVAAEHACVLHDPARVTAPPAPLPTARYDLVAPVQPAIYTATATL